MSYAPHLGSSASPAHRRAMSTPASSHRSRGPSRRGFDRDRLLLARFAGCGAAGKHEDRAGGLTDQPRGGAAQEDAPDRSPPAGADDEQVDPMRQLDERFDRAADDRLADSVDVE